MGERDVGVEAGGVEPARARGGWISRTVVGIVLATFFSDFSHEMATAVLPMYLGSIGLGAAALGVIEGVADFIVSMSKLGGGLVGHRVEHKRPVASAGYLVTCLATSAMGLVHTAGALLSLRSIAWMSRGFRGPLRDYLLTDEVEQTHYGRAFGLERAGDMLGAVSGPLVAVLCLWYGAAFDRIILWTIVPGLFAAGSMFFLTKERTRRADEKVGGAGERAGVVAGMKRLPREFWLFLGGVTLFGMGDFSRTFLILLAAMAFGEQPSAGIGVTGALSIAVLVYAAHNLVSAGAAYPIGRLGDRGSKRRVLVAGYALGVATNVLLAFASGSAVWLCVAVVMSGVYIATEETMEKAAAAELLPRELKSMGFGFLAFGNALGDMASSVYVGTLVQNGRSREAFLIAAGLGLLGVLWMVGLGARRGRVAKGRNGDVR